MPKLYLPAGKLNSRLLLIGFSLGVLIWPLKLDHWISEAPTETFSLVRPVLLNLRDKAACGQKMQIKTQARRHTWKDRCQDEDRVADKREEAERQKGKIKKEKLTVCQGGES